MSKPSAKRKQREERTVYLETTRGFDLRNKTHAHEFKTIDPPKLIRLLCKHLALYKRLQRKLRVGVLITRRDALRIMDVAEHAFYELETLDSYVAHEKFNQEGDEYECGFAGSVLPAFRSADGNAYLSYAVRRDRQRITTDRVIPMLSVGEDCRTVLISGHACRRERQRVGIKGNVVTFIARSIYPEARVRAQAEDSEPLLEIRGFENQVVEFCPTDGITCGLKPRSRYSNLPEDLLRTSRRWRLNNHSPRRMQWRQVVLNATRRPPCA